jgi:hypothetical protein
VDAIEWAQAHGASGKTEVVSDRPWALVTRVGDTWLKQCSPVQAYEIALTRTLAERWPDRIASVLATNDDRGWLLLADAGTPLTAFGDSADAWATAIPLYVELQQRETPHAFDLLAHGVPDLRPETLPARYEEWMVREPRLAPFADSFAELCASLTRASTVQHDDLHEANVYMRDGRITLLDWGDTCIAHPFATLYITCRWLARFRGDEAAERIRAAYLDGWGSDAEDELERVLPVAAFARLLQWERIGEVEAMERNLGIFLETVVGT